MDVIFDSFSQFNLSQYNTLRNPYGNTLDLIFSNLNYLATDLCSNPLVPVDLPHPPLNINIKCFGKKINYFNHQSIKKVFKKSDFVNISLALNNIKWNEMFSNT